MVKSGSHPEDEDSELPATMFDNAVTSIQLGVEDFTSGSERRLLSAVRNLIAGVLLLYKSRLSELSPSGSDDALVKKDIIPRRLPTGDVVFTGSGKRTVDSRDIEARFKSLGVHTDWDRFNKINGVRNDIEHYYTTRHPDAIRGLISDTFVIIRDFMHDELRVDPKDKLGDSAWTTLLSVSEVFEKERKYCQQLVEKIEWQSTTLKEAILQATCHKCGSALVAPLGSDRTLGIECRSCRSTEDFESIGKRALSDYLGWRNHFALKDGGEEGLIMCPFA